MQKICLTITLFLLSWHIQAQPPVMMGMPPGNNGHIYGKVVDPDGKSVSNASVIVLQNRLDTLTKKNKEILLKGVLTAGNGEFSIDELPGGGPLRLRISATGFNTYDQQITFPPFDKDLGKIKLTAASTQLKGVTVTATKPALQLDIDKKVFNVEKNLVSAGGTAVDVMKNVPSVNVDIDGNVSLRNSTPQLYIDGRPTTLTLDQIPADAIESVEVITNPSARYDASGGNAGILNIILKKNRKTGYNGNVRAGVDKRGALNGGGDFNLRQGKINIAASVMGNQIKSRTTGTTERNNFADNPVTNIFQSNNNRNNAGFLFGKLGVDYFITNRTTLSLSGVKVHGKVRPEETIDINTDTLYKQGIRNSSSQRNFIGDMGFNANGVVLGMKHLFPREGEELTTDFNYFDGTGTTHSDYTTYYFNKDNTPPHTALQQMLGENNIRFTTIQADYIRPFTNKMKLETGLRAAIRNTRSDFNTYNYDASTQQYVRIPGASSNYKNTDEVYAAYASLSQTIGNFGYKAGLRAESSRYRGDLLNTGEHFKNNYPISLFPSLFLSQKFKHDQELQLSYTRRINRPTFFQLVPFTDSTDKLNITKGNPNLIPEFTNSIELSYQKVLQGKHTFLGSIYYKHTNDLITGYISKEINPVNGQEVLINTYINANSSYTMGAELTTMNTFTKWWSITSNINLYNSQINVDNVQQASQAAMWSWFGKLNNTFRLPAGIELQLSAMYQSKTNLPATENKGPNGAPLMQAQSSSQGYIASFYAVDAAIRKTFLKDNAASVTLSFNDIFRSRRSKQYAESAYFTQTFDRLRDPQMIRLNFSYRFGKTDASLFKRKNMGAGMQGMSEVMQ
ncbi:outer membrane beta-barrel protein [Chitinophaga nivalis]|uniref:TonB-dependent receptor n=1 Tax=Chitinophaga nivalis TaxID=2991709 RepID=A0ABT3IGE5_9BACT|nr:outer membrane beta-barrel protein [Chitinophaga nivalis]MCW3467261.1 TonB-dependent receptor [Chitinophaga nivalis]MCW3483047.1 TonB-dependent receptor [Chitinophaga nivalis]